MNFSAEAARNGKSIFRKLPKPIIQFMRISSLICITAVISLKAIGISAKGQSMNHVKLSFSLTNESVESAIKKIESETSFRFLYRTSDLKNIKNITVNEPSITVSNLMKRLLTGSELSFKQVEDMIVISRKPVSEIRRPDVAADTVIRGTVYDGKSKEKIIGATIKVKNRTNAVLTDANGNFKISTPMGAVILVSYLGYETQEITITGPVLEIRLTESAQSLKGVVVTGIFSQSKSTYTGAARSFNREELSKVSNNNVLSALASLDPSFQIPDNLNLGSNPNILPDVVLRGGNTLIDTRQQATTDPFNYQASPNAPLFILDGFETSLQRINDLDMNRIASVTILKDAGATAIYGSRGANGVIVIEQLRPVEGKLRFTYNTSLSVENPDITGYDLLNAREKFELEDRSGVFKNTFNNAQNALDLVRENRLSAVARGINTDWLAKPLRTGIGQKHNIYVEGGAEAVTYGLSLTYDQKAGAMKGSDRKTTTGNTFLSYRLNDKFQFRNDLTLSFNHAQNSPYGSFRQYTRLNPYWTPYDDNGNLKIYLEEVINPETGLRVSGNYTDFYDNLNGYIGRPVNPLYNASLNIIDQTSYRSISNNFETRWQAKDWLRLTGRVSYTSQNDESDIFLPAQHSSFAAVPTFEKGSYTKGYGKTERLEGFLTAEANQSFGKHTISGSATLNVLQNSFDTQSVRVIGFPNPDLNELILGNQYPANSRPLGSESMSRTVGTLVRGAYNYDNRYLFDATYRVDGSSLFGSDKRFAPFWSVGAGWNAHNEAFLKETSMVNELRFRYSLGTTGSQSFESYKGVTTSQYFTDRDYRGVIASYLMGYGNEALAWQETLKHNFGMDATLFDRLSLNANYFYERTKGSIAFISSAPSTGFSGYYDNMGDVVNKGYEVYARYNIIAKPANRNNWSVFANLFHVTNTIEKISPTIKALNERANTSLSSVPLPRYSEGQSKNVIWGVPSLGIDPASGNELFRKRNGTITDVYDPADQIIIGDRTSSLNGTFGTNLELNGIGFNIFLRFDLGGDDYNQTLVDRVENVNVNQYNVDRRVSEQRWQQPGDQSLYKAIVNYAGLNNPYICYIQVCSKKQFHFRRECFYLLPLK